MLDKIEDNQSATRAIQAGKMIEVRLNPGVPFQGIGLKSKEINDRIKYDVLGTPRETGKGSTRTVRKNHNCYRRKHKMEIKFKTLTLHNFKSHRDTLPLSLAT
ncbi:hypothetical protein P7H12_21380 [Paenibacillus larvae]|nr:hypothetical protein [Paenibacillus larvae]MDT2265613.1 hypothetical protein [Paenibacillus larvae]